MSEIQEQLKQTVKKLFDEKKIDLFIGYEQAEMPMATTPCFISAANEVDRLVWNPYCLNNLAVYLPRYFIPEPKKKEQTFPRIGIAAKGCDARSIVGLIKEHQVPRENVFIVGLACGGLVDGRKVDIELIPDQITKVEENAQEITVSTDKQKTKAFKKAEVLDKACVFCRHHVPKVCDVLIGDEKDSHETTSDEFLNVEEFAARPIEERWRYFQEQMSRCIRCYACRNACPNCYCQECFAEATQPKWIGVTEGLSDVMLYHLGRLFHQAGRCVDCGACGRACPMGIDIRLFVRGLVKDVKQLFGYEPGLSLEEPPPLATFKLNDSQDFITEPRETIDSR